MHTRLIWAVVLALLVSLAVFAAIRTQKGTSVGADLITRLESDSENSVEPWNSQSFEEAVGKGAAIEPELLAAVNDKPDRRSLLALEALRRTSGQKYASLPVPQRAKIYADALARGKTFNLWGVPGFGWEEPAKAFIALGGGAVPALVPLLQDARDAQVWGSHGATAASAYRNRVKDYAFALISEMTGRGYDYKQDPAERDRLIGDLKQWLDANPDKLK